MSRSILRGPDGSTLHIKIHRVCLTGQGTSRHGLGFPLGDCRIAGFIVVVALTVFSDQVGSPAMISSHNDTRSTQIATAQDTMPPGSTRTAAMPGI
jgi:hypothetical protein